MKRNLPTLTGLRAFEVASRLRSFRKAADELCVTESSVSHQIRKLEEQLGAKLFHRLHRRVELTVAGIEYMIVVSRAFSEIEKSSVELAGHTDDARQISRLVVASDPGFAHHWLRSRVEDFTTQTGASELEVIPTLETGRELSNRATIGIHYGWRLTGAFNCEEIAQSVIFPVCRPSMINSGGELGSARLIHDRTVRMWGEWLRAAEIKDVSWTGGPIYHSSALTVQAALDGEGIAIADELLVRGYLERGMLVRPFEMAAIPSYRWYLITEGATREVQSADLFRSWLIEELSASTNFDYGALKTLKTADI